VVQLVLEQLHGEVRGWQRANRRFVAGLRRHLLLWRTIAAEDRARYIRYGETLQGTAPASEWRFEQRTDVG